MPLYKIHNSWLHGILERSYKIIILILIVYLITFIVIKLNEIFRKPLNKFIKFSWNITIIPPITIFLFPFYYFSLILAIILTWTITSNKVWVLYYSDITLKYISISLFFMIIYFFLALVTKLILKTFYK